MKLAVRVSNALLGLAWNGAFRPGMSPERMRRNFTALTSLEGKVFPRPRGRIERTSFGGVPVELVETGNHAGITLVYLHGGGYFMGDARGYRTQGLLLSKRLGARVVLVDYRLAPDHPHPAALDDARAAYLETLRRHPNDRIVVAGDSAGGGLTLSLLLSLRDRGSRLPERAIAISPWTDLTGSGASMTANDSKDVWLSRHHIDAWAGWYHGAADPRAPYVSPVFGDYRGLPPLLLLVGDQEVLLDDSTRIVDKARSAGVDARLVVGRDMQHDWFLLLPWLAESKRALAELENWVRPSSESRF